MKPTIGFLLVPVLLHLPNLLLGQDNQDKTEEKTKNKTIRPEDLDPDYNKNFSVVDATCKSDLDNIYNYDWNNATLNNATLYDQKGRFPSYIGYPCNVTLYNEYKKRFLIPYLKCPFQPGLDEKFRKFVQEELWTTRQHDPRNETFVNSSLMYQLICFSQQIEECVEDTDVLAKATYVNVTHVKKQTYVINATANETEIRPENVTKEVRLGACSGICKCMDQVPIAESQMPKDPHLNLNWTLNAPNQSLHLKWKCGVIEGKLCIHKWTPDCMNLSQPELERKYQPRDFYLPCERLAGCHVATRKCRCAEGHTCEEEVGEHGGERRSGMGDYGWTTLILVGTALLVKNALGWN